MSIRPLPSKLQEKTETELHESERRIKEDLNHIRDWLTKQPHLKCRKDPQSGKYNYIIDDQWLVSFIRGCKFKLERTKEKLDLYCSIRTLLPEFFNSRDPLSTEIQECLNELPLIVLPTTADSADPVTTIVRVVPENIPVVTSIKVVLMIMDILINENDNFVIAGQRSLIDLKGLTYKHVLEMTPVLTKKMMMCFEKAYPLRPQQFHIINAPSAFEPIYALMKMFASRKFMERMHLHRQNDLSSIYDHIPISILPVNYGGQGSPITDIAAEWKLKIEGYRNWFLEDTQYCSDETKRAGNPKTYSELFGVEGSFRKLEVD